MNTFIIRFFILFAFYVLGAYATTDIPRLLRGSTTAIHAVHCYCPVCGYQIRLTDQIPIISYLKNKGRCLGCHTQIPFSDIFLEIYIFAGCTVITILSSFTLPGILFCILFFEGTKLFYLVRKGPREKEFIPNLLRSLWNNLIYFLLLSVLFGLHRLISL